MRLIVALSLLLATLPLAGASQPPACLVGSHEETCVRPEAEHAGQGECPDGALYRREGYMVETHDDDGIGHWYLFVGNYCAEWVGYDESAGVMVRSARPTDGGTYRHESAGVWYTCSAEGTNCRVSMWSWYAMPLVGQPHRTVDMPVDHPTPWLSRPLA